MPCLQSCFSSFLDLLKKITDNLQFFSNFVPKTITMAKNNTKSIEEQYVLFYCSYLDGEGPIHIEKYEDFLKYTENTFELHTPIEEAGGDYWYAFEVASLERCGEVYEIMNSLISLFPNYVNFGDHYLWAFTRTISLPRIKLIYEIATAIIDKREIPNEETIFERLSKEDPLSLFGFPRK